MVNTQDIGVIGVGNPDCGDDSVGLKIIDQLENLALNGIQFIKASGETAGLIEYLGQFKQVILIDAIASAGSPGTIHCFDVTNTPLPKEMFTNYSTHSMGLDEAVEMARVLGNLPEKTLVFGIEGANFEPGDPLSSEVRSHFNDLIERIVRKISDINH